MTTPSTVLVCPFCPLHCDDVTLDPQRRPVVDCDLAANRFRHTLGPPTPPRLGIADSSGATGPDASVTEQRIAETVRDRVKAAERIVLVSAGTDLRTARDLDDLASADPRIVLRIDASPTRQAMASAVSREGVVAATIADVRRHADQIWLLGIRAGQFPRLLDRLIDPDRPATVHHSPDGISADRLAKLASPPPFADVPNAFTSSSYLAVVVGDHAFRPVEAEAAAELLVQMIHRLNAETRAVIVQFDRAATDRCVAAWRGNRSLAADRDPITEDPITEDPITEDPITEDPITEDEVRIRVGTANLANPEPGPPVTLQIGGAPPDPDAAEAYVPAADVGVHRHGAVVRGDGTVTLPLSQLAESPLPTATEWLRTHVFAAEPTRRSEYRP